MKPRGRMSWAPCPDQYRTVQALVLYLLSLGPVLAVQDSAKRPGATKYRGQGQETRGFVPQTLVKKRRLWKTDLHVLDLRFPHPLHIVGRVSMTLLKKCRLWKTDLHVLGLHFPHPLHIVGRVSIRAVFRQSLLNPTYILVSGIVMQQSRRTPPIPRCSRRI